MPRADELRVLLVDDDPSVILGYERYLRREGATVTSASNGKEAAERVKVAQFDVIVTDISMAEMTGIEFLNAVRAYDLDVPVILMTGDATVESGVAPKLTFRQRVGCVASVGREQAPWRDPIGRRVRAREVE